MGGLTRESKPRATIAAHPNVAILTVGKGLGILCTLREPRHGVLPGRGGLVHVVPDLSGKKSRNSMPLRRLSAPQHGHAVHLWVGLANGGLVVHKGPGQRAVVGTHVNDDGCVAPPHAGVLPHLLQHLAEGALGVTQKNCKTSIYEKRAMEFTRVKTSEMPSCRGMPL
jgi:hypothetical protein